MIDIQNAKIEYLGLNVLDGKLFNKKTYYFYDKFPISIPNYIQNILKPFDFGKRESGFSYSFSSFIPFCDTVKLKILLNFIVDICEISIDKELFLSDFCKIAMLEKNIHYDPIVSFKIKDEKICGVSFYVTALKDKSLVPMYYEQVKDLLQLDYIPKISKFCKMSIENHFADMFQIAWDFDKSTFIQNKLYLKVKDKTNFIISCKEYFPYIENYTNIDCFRFCELAFAISNNQLHMLNLYFKPL